MKAIITLFLSLFLAGSMFAQNIIDQHFSSYKAKENVTKVNVTGKMFELAAYIDNEDNDPDLEAFKRFAATIDEFNMLVGKEEAKPKALFTSAEKKVAASHEELMRIEDKDATVTFFIDESKGIVRELVMVGMTPDNFMVFSLTGNMSLSELSKMSKKLQDKGFAQMGKLHDQGLHNLKVYPNPGKVNETLNLEVPAEMGAENVRILDMNGRTVKTHSLKGNTSSLSTQGLAPGTYILEIQADGARVRRKIVLQ